LAKTQPDRQVASRYKPSSPTSTGLIHGHYRAAVQFNRASRYTAPDRSESNRRSTLILRIQRIGRMLVDDDAGDVPALAGGGNDSAQKAGCSNQSRSRFSIRSATRGTVATSIGPSPRSPRVLAATCHSTLQPYAPILVVARAQCPASLIVPHIRPLRAVTSDGGDTGGTVSPTSASQPKVRRRRFSRQQSLPRSLRKIP
jgi:hypothetical protein